jgi:hypothetical protein
VPHTCRAHQWDHPTESCPYCREIGDASNARRAAALPGDDCYDRGDAARVTEWLTHDVVGSGPVRIQDVREIRAG